MHSETKNRGAIIRAGAITGTNMVCVHNLFAILFAMSFNDFVKVNIKYSIK